MGYLGQSGHYTDPETQPIAPGGLLSVGGSYYDMKLGRYLTRGGDINGYKALSNSPASYVDWVGVAQTTIDTVGMIPFLNVPCSVVSAGISAARGEWSGMGLSLLAVVPVEGEGDEALKVARDAKSLEKGVADAGEEVSREGSRVPPTNCFVAGTSVRVAGGTAPIEQVRAHDLVWSRDPATGRTELRRVVRTFRHRAQETITVGLADARTGRVVQTLTATPGHRFFVAGRGAVALGSLGVGTQIVTRAGPPLLIASLVHHHDPQGVWVYNLEVQGDHTYFVGNAHGGAWVHNTCSSSTTTAIGRMDDLTQFDGIEGIDTWWKTGRKPGPDEPLVSWRENQQWLDERIQRGDNFVLASPESSLSPIRIPGVPNGNFTFRELQYLRSQGIEPYHAY